MQMVQRLNERDLKMLAIDRNVPESVRLAARKIPPPRNSGGCQVRSPPRLNSFRISASPSM